MRRRAVAVFSFCAAAMAACGPTHHGDDLSEAPSTSTPNPSYATPEHPFEPLPLEVVFDRRAAELGEKLYADPLMSLDRSLTCLSCHDFAKGGTDGLPKPSVPTREPGKINTGTIFNLAFNSRFNWNGKFATLLSHVNGPVTGKLAMGITWPDLTARIRSVPEYRRGFKAVYPDEVTAANIRDAVTNYQRSLITPNAPFDRYLRGDDAALGVRARQGYLLFKSLGCASCHQGINIGGNMLAKFGVLANYFVDRAKAGDGAITETDYGRFLVTGREEHKFVFRVPSLRNVACTGPYLHDGTKNDLDDVVAVMGKYQLGRPLEAEQIELLVVFLNTLTGELEGKPLCGPRGVRL